MVSSRVEFLFLKTAIEQFIKDLQKIDGLMRDGLFSADEELEVMAYLVAAKERIEGMETSYSAR